VNIDTRGNAMFFFIGGIQPRSIEIDNKARMCPSCGLYQAKLKRVDNYLSLFFIPILRVKKGNPFLLCRRCGVASKQTGGEPPLLSNEIQQINRCPRCGSLIEKGFNFCPFCGGRV
jgi:hypothetical protein